MPNQDGTPRDNSDQPFLTGTRSGLKPEPEAGKLFNRPELFICNMCNGDSWYIFADAGGTGYVQFRCKNPNCKAACPTVQLVKPQMDSDVARRHGLWVPPTGGNMSVIDTIMGGDDD